MAPTLVQREAFGELDKVACRLNETVREVLLAMSPATIDRMLRPTAPRAVTDVKAEARQAPNAPGSCI